MSKSYGEVGRGLRNNWLDFGGNPSHDLDPGIFKGFIIYYCDSCRQPRKNMTVLRRYMHSTECCLATVVLMCCSYACSTWMILITYLLAGASQCDGWSYDQRQWSVFWHWQIPWTRWYDPRVLWSLCMALWKNWWNFWPGQVFADFVNVWVCLSYIV